MSENKNIKEEKNVKTKVKSEEKKKPQEKKEGKFKISDKRLALIITAAILVVVIIAAAIVLVVQAIKKDVGFNYLTSDLSKYIEFTEDYKDFEIELDIVSPRELDLDEAILNLLCSDKSEKANYGGSLITSPWNIGPGDIVHIRYRGYIIDDSDEKIEIINNFADESAAQIEVGSNTFPVSGFEFGLSKIYTGDLTAFEKITEGKVEEGQIVYVSFTRVTDTDSTTKVTSTNVRIDLSDEKIDKNYGKGFKEKLLVAEIGKAMDFALENSEGKKYNYTDVKVNFATECESEPTIIEGFFPYDYSVATLKNEKAYFEIYVEGVVDYDAPEFNDEYLKKKIEEEEFSITEKDLANYEGETLVEKYRAFAMKTLTDNYVEEYKDLLEQAIWSYYSKNSKVLKYPAIKVEEIYKDYIANLLSEYESSGGKIYNSSYGTYQTYDSFETYAPAYLGLSSTADWVSYLFGMAESMVKEKLIMYYILRNENLTLSDDELKAECERVRQDYLDRYVETYLKRENKTREDYTDEEYEKFLDERRGEIFSYYDDAHFEETAYYSIVTENMLKWPDVITLEERRAYPSTK